jgi:hypothetical protein
MGALAGREHLRNAHVARHSNSECLAARSSFPERTFGLDKNGRFPHTSDVLSPLLLRRRARGRRKAASAFF